MKIPIKDAIAYFHRVITMLASACIFIAAYLMTMGLYADRFTEAERTVMRAQYGTLFFMFALAFGSISALISWHRTSEK